MNSWQDDERPQRRGIVRSLAPPSENLHPREEPFRNFGGWKCPHCGSGNTIIEGYNSGPEGYCMTCTRYIEIPKENLNAYRNSRSSR